MFVTSGLPESRFLPYTRNLEQKDFEVVGISSCRGFDTRLPFKLVGGVNTDDPTSAGTGQRPSAASCSTIQAAVYGLERRLEWSTAGTSG